MKKNNSLHSKVTIRGKNNSTVTITSNTLPRTLKQFYEKAKQICEKEQRPFSLHDFPAIKPNNFRQIIHKIRPLVEVVHKSNPTFYKIKGVKLPGDSHKITIDHMVGEYFYKILDSLKLVDPMIHDIRIKVNDSSMYQKLDECKATKNPNNSSFTINVPQFDNNIVTKVSVYPKTVLIMLGCTYKPLVYNSSTIWYLHEHLSKISYHLSSLGAFLPPVNEWVCTHYHMNKDGSQSLSGQSFHFTVEEVSSGMLRFYSKNMKDGRTISRLEWLQSPNRTISEEMKLTMFAKHSML